MTGKASCAQRAVVPSIYDIIDIYGKSNRIDQSLVNSICGALRARDAAWLKLITDELSSPYKHRDGKVYYRYAALTALYSKMPLFEASDAEQVSFAKWVGVMKRMVDVNQKFYHMGLAPMTYKVLNRASAWLRKNVLPSRSCALDKLIINEARHGPGATVDVGAREASPLRKFSRGKLSGTDYAVALFRADTDTQSIVTNALVEVARFNNGTQVPKNMWTRRPIAIEPTLSVYYQLGLGIDLSRRLKRVGIDLKDQSVNQRRALRGSLTGEYATLDASSASDSISLGLVEYLFQPNPTYLRALYGLRSSVSYVGDVMYALPILSSMGNGFTFPLESAIFYALCRGVCEVVGIEPDITVYGDDMVVPCAATGPIAETLMDLGIKLNAEKTFSSGPFRESCGADFWSGTAVRPIFLKTFDYLPLLSYYNNMYGRPEYEKVREYLHSFVRHFGPPHQERHDYGWTDDEGIWSKRYRRRYQCMEYQGVVAVPIDFREYPEARQFRNKDPGREYLCDWESDNWSHVLEETAYLHALWKGGNKLALDTSGQRDFLRDRVRLVSRWAPLHGLSRVEKNWFLARYLDDDHGNVEVDDVLS